MAFPPPTDEILFQAFFTFGPDGRDQRIHGISRTALRGPMLDLVRAIDAERAENMAIEEAAANLSLVSLASVIRNDGGPNSIVPSARESEESVEDEGRRVRVKKWLSKKKEAIKKKWGWLKNKLARSSSYDLLDYIQSSSGELLTEPKATGPAARAKAPYPGSLHREPELGHRYLS